MVDLLNQIMNQAQTEARNALVAAIRRIDKEDQNAITCAKDYLHLAMKAKVPAGELERALNTPVIRGSANQGYAWQKRFKDVCPYVELKFEDFDSADIKQLKINEHYLDSLSPLNVAAISNLQDKLQKKRMGLETHQFFNTLNPNDELKYRTQIDALNSPFNEKKPTGAQIAKKFTAVFFENCKQTEKCTFENTAHSHFPATHKENDDAHLMRLKQQAKQINDKILKFQPLVADLYALHAAQPQDGNNVFAINSHLYEWHHALDHIPQLKVALGLPEGASDQDMYQALEKLYVEHEKASLVVFDYIKKVDDLGAWAENVATAYKQTVQLNQFAAWFKGKIDLSPELKEKHIKPELLPGYHAVKNTSRHNGTNAIANALKPFIELMLTFDLNSEKDRAELNAIWQNVNATVTHKDNTEGLGRSFSGKFINPQASTQVCIAQWQLILASSQMSTAQVACGRLSPLSF